MDNQSNANLNRSLFYMSEEDINNRHDRNSFMLNT